MMTTAGGEKGGRHWFTTAGSKAALPGDELRPATDAERAAAAPELACWAIRNLLDGRVSAAPPDGQGAEVARCQAL